ncbi:hypothetical protein Tco_0568991 [Tanacetum coccineum]
MKAICKLDVPVVSKAPKHSSQTEEVSQGKKPGAKSGLRKNNLQNTHLMVGEMHKEAQQAAIGPTSLGPPVKKEPTLSSVVDIDEGTKNYLLDHIFAGSNLSVLVDKTKSAGDGLKTAHTDSSTNEEYRADDISKKIKALRLTNCLKRHNNMHSHLILPDSPQDDTHHFTNESEEKGKLTKKHS